MFCPCLFVCLSISKITQKRVHGFGWNVACRQLLGHGRTELLSPIRIMVRMPGPYCSLRYHIGYTELCSLAIGCQPAACYAEFYVGKIPHIRIGGAPLERAVVLKWFYSLSRQKTFVGGKCTLPSALLIHSVSFSQNTCMWQTGTQTDGRTDNFQRQWPNPCYA